MKRLVLIAAIPVAFVMGALLPDQPDQPCKWEDEVLVGTGDFVQGRGWDAWICMPADDIEVTR